ncbi:hypothetical protein ABFS82_02G084200 [Erythranthe guttata]
MILSNSPLMETQQCNVCRSADAVALHNLHHRGALAFLCSACVLRRHPGKFCPLCFEAYDDATTTANTRPSAHSRITCHRCTAVVHSACLPSSVRPSSTTLRYLCPQCSHPSSSPVVDSKSDDGRPVVFTRDLAKQIFCAAKIVSVIMHKAAAAARADAEQKAGEAIAAKKKAKQAIERASYVMANEQARAIANQQEEDDSDIDDE